MSYWIDVVNWDKSCVLPPGVGYDARSEAASGIGLHTTSGRKNSTLEAEARFLRDSRKVGCNWLIGKDAEILEILAAHFAPWHAGTGRYLGRDDWNDFSLGIEFHHSKGDPWPQKQLDAGAWLCQRLMRHFPAITHNRIALHRWIAPGRKTDPDDLADPFWRAWIAAL